MKNKEIRKLEWFIPTWNVRKMISGEEAFIKKSEKGINPDFSKISNPYRYFQLIEGKRWRGITIHEMWEKGIRDVSLWTLLGGENPREIPSRDAVNFLKKEMFKGKKMEEIENCYQSVLKHWNLVRRLFFILFYFIKIIYEIPRRWIPARR